MQKKFVSALAAVILALLGSVLLPARGARAEHVPMPASAAASGSRPAQVEQKQTPLERLIKAAAREGKLTFVGSAAIGNPHLWARLEREINTKYNTNVKLNFSPGPSFTDMTARVAVELRAGRQPSTDLLIGSPETNNDRLAQGILEPVNWRKLDPSIPEETIEGDGCCVVVGSRIQTTVAYNTNIYSAGQVPKSLDALRDSKWCGKIATTSLATSWDRIALIAGEEKVTATLENLVKNHCIAGFMRASDMGRVGSGEFPLFVWASHTDVQGAKDKGVPVDFTVMDEGVMLTSHTISVTKNAESPNLAKLVVIYVTLPEGQKAVWDIAQYDSAFVKGSHMKELVDRLRSENRKVVVENAKLAKNNPHFYKELNNYYRKLIRQ